MKKTNVAELLKDCPKGMELDCTICNGLKFIELDRNPNFPIVVRANNGYEFSLTRYGQVHNIDDAKCVIFPKGKTTWEGFHRPFKDGDIVCYLDSIAIFKEWGDATLFRTHVTAYLHGHSTIDIAIPLFGKSIRREASFATEEEKAKLFKAIKDNGYKWNAETKTLEKLVEPKFKVDDRIRNKETHDIFRITSIDKDSYHCGPNYIWIANQDEYELVPDKFDITTLKPFESRVLVRDDGYSLWQPSLWGLYDKEHRFPYVTIGYRYKQCIPYEGNQHLLGTTDDCTEYFKTWK